MCHKVSIPTHCHVHNYVYNSPIPIKDRPQLIHSFADSSINLLHKLRTSFIVYDKQLPKCAQAHTHTNRVHFYLYLLDKITLCIGFVTKWLEIYELLWYSTKVLNKNHESCPAFLPSNIRNLQWTCHMFVVQCHFEIKPKISQLPTLPQHHWMAHGCP